MTRTPSRDRATRYRRDALASIEEERFDDALVLLSFALEHDPGYRPAYETATEILRFGGRDDEADLFDDALATFDRPEAFARLGNYFLDQRFPRLAIPFLERADRLDPHRPETTLALAISLAAEGRFTDAMKVLRRHPALETHFWPCYELAYAQFLSGSIERARRALEKIRQREDQLRPTVSEEEAEDFEAAIERLESGLRRHRGLGESRDDASIRDWHYIQYGGIVLDYCDERFGKGSRRLAGGRYVALWSEPEMVIGVLRDLGKLLDAFGLHPRRVVHAPDRESEILSLIAAGLLDLPPAGSLDDDPDRRDALVVVSSSDVLDELPELVDRDLGEILFCYHLAWPRDCMMIPEIAGLMAQIHAFPWEDLEHPDEIAAFEIPADPRAPEEIAEWVLTFGPFPPPLRRDRDLAFYLERRQELLLDEWVRHPRRERYLTNSPVPGWRFA